MPTFKLNKLVRDGLIERYKNEGQQPNVKKLSGEILKRALADKIIEEIKEIDFIDKNETLNELADVKQVFDDILKICEISMQEIEDKRIQKFNDKGGFTGGNYVESIKLNDDDKWVEYYRDNPDVFHEE